MENYDSWEVQRWWIAIEAANTWREPSERGPKKKSDLRSLAALIGAETIPESVRQSVKDVLERHQLKANGRRTPAYILSDREADTEVYEEFANEFRQSPHRLCGPITTPEMDRAAKVMQGRAKAEGRANCQFDGKAAATALREEQIRAFTNYYWLNHERFLNVLNGKDGSINRMKRAKKRNPPLR